MTGQPPIPRLLSLIVAGLTILVLATTTLEAKTRAVLVGVSDYQYLDADLDGPKNDVRIVSSALIGRGVLPEDIIVLTDPSQGLDPRLIRKLPKRQNILDALQKSVEQSVKDDTLIFYFSGHGSQAPDINGDEQGGYDEIFLPSDAKSWNGPIGAVENAILDDELNIIARNLLARGGKLVAIIDACHSGTGFRAIGGAGKARYIDPTELGIPEQEITETSPPSEPLEGNFVFLYSSQSNQRSFEYPLGDATDKSHWYGDFTRNLVNVLNGQTALSYQQLLQATSQSLRASNGQVAQTPDGEGTLLNAPVFGSDTAVSKRISIKKGKLSAGKLNDIRTGSRISLYNAAVGADILGYATVTHVTPTDADLKFEDPDHAVKAKFAEIVALGVAATLDVNFNPDVMEQILRFGTHAKLTSRLSDVSVRVLNGEADNTIIKVDTKLALVGRDGVLDSMGPGGSPRLADLNSKDVVSDLVETLDRIARKRRLEAALQTVESPSSGMGLFKTGITVEVEQRFGKQTPNGCKLRKNTPARHPLPVQSNVAHCDQIWVHLTNSTSKMWDVTVLYIDKDSTITALWPQNNLSNRLPSAASKSFGFRLENPSADTGGSIAAESLIVLSVAAKPGDTRTVLTGLAESGSSRAIGQGAWFDALSSPMNPQETSRNFSLSGSKSSLSVDRFDLIVAPEI